MKVVSRVLDPGEDCREMRYAKRMGDMCERRKQ